MEWTGSLTGLGWALSSSKAKWEGFLGLGRYQTRLERFDLEALRSEILEGATNLQTQVPGTDLCLEPWVGIRH